MEVQVLPAAPLVFTGAQIRLWDRTSGLNGEEVRRIRTKLELTQGQMAEVLGLSWKTVSNIELGSRNPSSLAAAILRLLDKLPSKKAQALMGLIRKYMEK